MLIRTHCINGQDDGLHHDRGHVGQAGQPLGHVVGEPTELSFDHAQDDGVPSVEVAVDGRTGHLRVDRDVIDRGLGQTEPDEARLGRIEKPLARFGRVERCVLSPAAINHGGDHGGPFRPKSGCNEG